MSVDAIAVAITVTVVALVLVMVAVGVAVMVSIWVAIALVVAVMVAIMVTVWVAIAVAVAVSVAVTNVVKGADMAHGMKGLTGKNVFIRTVTYHYTGRIVRETPKFLVLTDAAWIADSGRFADAMATGSLSEVEPYPDGCEVSVAWTAIVDLCEWAHPLPRQRK
jgi:hypothetical protein